MKKNKPVLKSKEKAILDYIHEHGGAITANEIAEKTGMSYVTVRKYLDQLVKEGILEVNKDDP